MTRPGRMTAAAVAVLTLVGAAAAILHYRRSGNPVLTEGGTDQVTLQFFRNPKPVPAFTMLTTDGLTISPADLHGKVTILNFWATWCPPCKAEIPDLIALQDKYRDHLLVIGISEDEGAPEVVNRFAAEHRVNYPIVMSTPELRRAFPGVSGLPTSFILDRAGRIVQKHVGMLSATRTEQETRALAGLPLSFTVEHIDPAEVIGLANAAQAKEIPGLDLTRLSSEKRVQVLLRLNAEACPCGCGLTVARCRVDDPACSLSLPLARQLTDEIGSQP